MKLKHWFECQIPLHELIINASDKTGKDQWVDWPIGIGVQCNLNNIIKVNSNLDSSKMNSKEYCCSFMGVTDKARRGNKEINRYSIDSILKKNGYQKTSSGRAFFQDLFESRFTFSPEGNGIDTHRTYEALIFKCIPIVEKNQCIIDEYEGLPILYTTDYSEINSKYLEDVYSKMLDTEYDFAKLFLSYYDDETKGSIIENGNHWVGRYPKFMNISKYWPVSFELMQPPIKNVNFISVTSNEYIETTKIFIDSLKRVEEPYKVYIICKDEKSYMDLLTICSDKFTILKFTNNDVLNIFNETLIVKAKLAIEQFEKFGYIQMMQCHDELILD
jgi:hypothetical protein